MAESVYMDYNATTPCAPEVIKSITDCLQTGWGNPGSSYKTGRCARMYIDKARSQVAEMIGATCDDIIFTSGGTEANNMVIQNSVKCFKNNRQWNNCHQLKPHFVSTNVEHPSVSRPLDMLVLDGQADVTFVPVNTATGCIDATNIISAVQPNTVLVSVILANNETGIVMPLVTISKQLALVNSNRIEDDLPPVLLHTDAAQSIGKLKIDIKEIDVDFMTLVGHKFYGPRIGALYIKHPVKDTPMCPMIFGGGQEKGLRSGTENTPMIAGFGTACMLVTKNVSKYAAHMSQMQIYLEKKLKEQFGDKAIINCKGDNVPRLPNTTNVSFIGKGLRGRAILDICHTIEASVGAACHSNQDISYILMASGIPPNLACNAIRLSTGRETTTADIDKCVTDIKQASEKIQMSLKMETNGCK